MNALIIAVLVAVALFFAFREINLWYWKINEIIRLLTVIAGEKRQSVINIGQNQNQIENARRVVICKYCTAISELDSNEIENKRFICPTCNKENIL